MATNDTLRKALKCVVTRLRVMSKDGLGEPQKRWLGHTIDIAENALADSIEAAWMRERKPGRNCDRFDGYLDAVKAFKGERRGVEVTIENVLYWLFQPIKKEVS